MNLLVLSQSSSGSRSSMGKAFIFGTTGVDFGVNVVTAGNIILFDGLRSMVLFLVITIILYNKI